MSLGVATGTTPVQALEDATSHLHDAGSAQDKHRREILRGRAIDAEFQTDEDVQIAHFDVNDATGKYTDQLNEFDAFIQIEQGYAALMQYMREAYDSLSFFVGGDNVIAVCSDMNATDYRDVIEHVNDAVDVELKVGVGRGQQPHEAGMDAKHALESCRADGTDVEVHF
jgi:GTP cyclohydrolase IIa